MVVHDMVPKPEDDYSLPVPPVMLLETATGMGEKRTQPAANYAKPTKSSKPKGDDIDQLARSLEKLSITAVTQEDLQRQLNTATITIREDIRGLLAQPSQP
jgi:hypothetical protein